VAALIPPDQAKEHRHEEGMRQIKKHHPGTLMRH
jgi:hypothetical protein